MELESLAFVVALAHTMIGALPPHSRDAILNDSVQHPVAPSVFASSANDCATRQVLGVSKALLGWEKDP